MEEIKATEEAEKSRRIESGEEQVKLFKLNVAISNAVPYVLTTDLVFKRVENVIQEEMQEIILRQLC